MGCFLYYIFRPENSTDTGELNKTKKLSGKGIKVGVKLTGALGSVIIGQMQLVKIIMSTIKWSPQLPRWLIGILDLLGNMLSINVPSMVSSPECMSDMQPLEKWSFAIAVPWSLLVVFICWYLMARCHFKSRKKYDPNVVQTILASAVNVLLISKFFFPCWVFISMYMLN